MSAPTPPADAAAAAPKKKSKLPIIIALVALLVAGGGGGGYFFFMRAGAATKEGGEKEKKEKSAKGHGAEEEEGAGAEEGEEGEEHHAAEGAEEEAEEGEKQAKHSKKAKKESLSMPDDSKVKEVIELQPFIVNLADPGESHYLRLTVNVGVGGGEEGGEGEEGKPNPLFTTRVRNAMLAVLTTKTSDEILTAEGKNALRKELLKAARKVSEEPKVYAIYITDFIVQL